MGTLLRSCWFSAPKLNHFNRRCPNPTGSEPQSYDSPSNRAASEAVPPSFHWTGAVLWGHEAAPQGSNILSILGWCKEPIHVASPFSAPKNHPKNSPTPKSIAYFLPPPPLPSPSPPLPSPSPSLSPPFRLPFASLSPPFRSLRDRGQRGLADLRGFWLAPAEPGPEAGAESAELPPSARRPETFYD